MNNTDFEILKEFSPSIGLTEIYLGYVQYPWHYAIADYSADRTEGIPFDVFDKVLCSLLQLDGKLSVVELGDILGFNIEENVSEGKYRDLAEYEILTEKLNELASFGLVDFSDGYYSLTNQGVESLKVERKFRNISGYDFTLYYDLTGNQHNLARIAFEDAARTDAEKPTIFKYVDDNLIKSFANDQIPNFYKPEDGNSFSNLRINAVDEYINEVVFGVIYDFFKKEFRLVSYCPMIKCDLYAKAIDDNPILKSEILNRFLLSQKLSTYTASSIQNSYEETAIEALRSIEYKEYLGQDTIPETTEYHESETVIIPEIFWTSLVPLLSPYNSNKICFCIDYLTVEIIKFIKYFATQVQNAKIFVSYKNKAEEVRLTESDNLYFCQIGATRKQLCSVDDKVVFELEKFIYGYKGQKYERSVIVRPENQYDCPGIFDDYVRTWLPNYLRFFCKAIDGENIIGNLGVSFLRSLESKLEVFMPYLEPLNLIDDYNKTVRKRNSILANVKESHIEDLKKQLLEFVGKYNFEELTNLNEVQDVLDQLSAIEKDCFEDYSEVNDLISSVKKSLKDRENYIRDIKLAKTYIIDTNVFINDPDILSKIKMPNKAVICAKVTDELDKHKIRNKTGEDLHINAEKALRNINQALKKDKSRVVRAKADITLLPPDFTDKSADNLILCVALMYKDKNPCLLTADNGLQVKAQICDIPTKNLQEFYEMLENLKAERAKRAEVEDASVVKTKQVYSQKNNKFKHNKRK